MRVKADVDILRQIPLFAGTDPAHLQLLSFSSNRTEIETGRILLRQGDRGSAAYLVLDGAAEVYEDPDAAGTIVATIERGAFIGELSMVADLPYGVTVKTVSPVAAQRIDSKLFLRVVAEFPEFGALIVRNMTGKLYNTAAAFDHVKCMFE